jgi:hypothetical protein
MRHRSHWGRNVLAAPLAVDYEVAEAGLSDVEHANSIGEIKANIFTTSVLPVIHP